MVLTEKTQKVYDFIKAQDDYSCTTAEIMAALGLEKINQVTGCVNSLVKKELAVREDGGKDDAGKKITIVKLTDAGINFVPSEDDAE